MWLCDRPNRGLRDVRDHRKTVERAEQETKRRGRLDLREVEEGMNFDGFLGMALPPAGGQPPGLEGGTRGQGGPPPGNPFNLNTAPHQPQIRPLQVCAEY